MENVTHTDINSNIFVQSLSCDSEIMLKWSIISTADSYQVFTPDKQEEFQPICTTKSCAAKISGLKNGKIYKFIVKSFDSENNLIGISETFTASPFCVPESISVENGDKQATLCWDEVPFADGYKIYRLNGETKKYHEFKYSPDNKITLELENDAEYIFRVRAFRLLDGEERFSGFSVETTAKPANKQLCNNERIMFLSNYQVKTLNCFMQKKIVTAEKWESLDPKIATVDEKGNVTAASAGYTEITSYYGGKTAITKVYVERKAHSQLYPVKSLKPKEIKKKTAVLLFTGNIFCSPSQQKTALNSGILDFSSSFRQMEKILKTSDYSVCMLNNVISQSNPYGYEEETVSDTTNYNCPSTILDAIKYSGLSCIANTIQPDFPLTKTHVNETLSNIKRYELDSIGFTSENSSPQFVVKTIKGASFAVIACNSIGNSAKTAFGEKNSMFSAYSADLLKDTIAKATSKGAKYIVVIADLSSNPRDTAQEIADSGADFIIGSNHELQRFDTISTKNGKEVPVAYSLGYFSDDVCTSTHSGRSMLLRMELWEELGKVRAAYTYIPCKILEEFEGRNNVTIPLTGGFDNNLTFIGEKQKTEKLVGEKIDTFEYQTNVTGKPTFRIMGTRLLSDLFDRHENLVVDKKMQDCSAFTLFFPGERVENAGIEPPFQAVLDIKKTGFNYIKNEPTDYFVLDLFNTAITSVFKIKEQFYAGNKDFLSSGFYVRNMNNAELVQPFFPEKLWKTFIDIFIENLKYLYRSDRIILVRVEMPKTHCENKQFKYTKERNLLNVYVRKIEDYFIKKVQPVVFDISKYYFSDKDNVEINSDLSYESYFYKHLDKLLNTQLDGMKKRIYDTNDEEIFLERCMEYYPNMRKRNTFTTLLERTPADLIIQNTSREFISRFKRQIIQIKKLGFANLAEVLKAYDFGENLVLKKAVELIYAVDKNTFTNLKYRDFNIVFEYGFTLQKQLCVLVKKKIEETNLCDDVDINTETLPFYLKTLLEFNQSDDIEKAKRAIEVFSSTKELVRIDIWGSNITLEAVDFSQHLYVKKYIYSNPFIFAFDKPVTYTKSVMESDKHFCNNIIGRKFVKATLDRDSKKIIASSTSPWIIVDFYDLACEMASYNGQCFEVDDFIKRTLFFESIKGDCELFYLRDRYDSAIFKTAMDKFVALLTAKYKCNIILNRVNLRHEYVDIDGNVKPLNIDKQALNKTQAIISSWEKYFYQKTNCYVINLSKNYLSDVNNPFGGADIGNYEEMYYKNTAVCMEYIIRNNPEIKIIDPESAL